MEARRMPVCVVIHFYTSLSYTEVHCKYILCSICFFVMGLYQRRLRVHLEVYSTSWAYIPDGRLERCVYRVLKEYNLWYRCVGAGHGLTDMHNDIIKQRHIAILRQIWRSELTEFWRKCCLQHSTLYWIIRANVNVTFFIHRPIAELWLLNGKRKVLPY